LEQLRPLCGSVWDFWSSWDHCAALQETWCRILTVVVPRVPWACGMLSNMVVFVTVTRFATSWYGMYYLSLCILYIRSIWQQMVVEHHRRSTWGCPSRVLWDSPLGGHCGEMTELEWGEPPSNVPPPLSWLPHRIHEKKRLSLDVHRKVKWYDTTWPWGSRQSHGTTKSQKQWVGPNFGQDRECIFVVW